MTILNLNIREMFGRHVKYILCSRYIGANIFGATATATYNYEYEYVYNIFGVVN